MNGHVKICLAICLSVSFTALPFKVAASDVKADLTELLSNANEMAFFAAKKSGNFSEWVHKASLTKYHKDEIMAYLRGHRMENGALPKLNWTYLSSVIEVGDSKSMLRYDFSNVLHAKRFLVNGVEVEAKELKSFDAVVEAILKTTKANRKSASSQWLEYFFTPAAAATTVDESVFGAIYYGMLIDELMACFGNENQTKAECTGSLRSNASMIMADLGSKAQIYAFKCSSDGDFSSLQYNNEDSIPLQITCTQDPKNKTQILKTFEDDIQTCEYDLKNGRLTSFTNLKEDFPNYCDGRTRNEFQGRYHPFRSGDKPKVVAATEVPIDRLVKCCASKPCQKSIAAEIAAENGKDSSHSSDKSNSTTH